MLALLLTSGCIVLNVQNGNGIPATQDRDVGDFSGVRNEFEADVFIAFGSPSVTVSCDENLVENIETVVEEGILVIRAVNAKGLVTEIIPHTTCTVDISTPVLNLVSTTGSGEILVQGGTEMDELRFALSTIETTGSGNIVVQTAIQANEIEITLTGSGDVQIADITTSDVDASLTGSGDCTLTGSTDMLDATLTGSGDGAFASLSANTVRITLTGSGDASVTAQDRVEATLMGSGDLSVSGNPSDRDVQETGSGEVVFK